MEAFDYQKWSKSTAIYKPEGAIPYLTLGLVGEAGEVANKVKKVLRDNDSIMTPEVVEKIGDEIGDTMWYVARLLDELGLDIREVLQKNHDKLEDRKARNVIQGSGDKR